MALKFGKRDISKMAVVLDADYESVEEAAEAALEAAMSIIETKAKYTVVGQKKWRRGVDEPGDKIALGWYGTEKQALADALSLTYSTQTHEEFLAWVLPIHHGTPHTYYRIRKDKKVAQATADSSYRERELARRIKWINDNPNAPIPEEWGVIPMEQVTVDCPFCDGSGQVIPTESEAA